MSNIEKFQFPKFVVLDSDFYDEHNYKFYSGTLVLCISFNHETLMYDCILPPGYIVSCALSNNEIKQLNNQT